MSPSSRSGLAEAVERARGAVGVSGKAVSPKFGALVWRPWRCAAFK